MEPAVHQARFRIATRAITVWLVLIVAEILHGIARGIFLVPHVGEFRSSQIGVFSGSIIILAVAVVLVANLIFTPIQFGMRNLPLAAVDILVVWTTILWMAVAIWRHYKWVAVAQVPYLIWVSLATVLQLSITVMNWGR